MGDLKRLNIRVRPEMHEWLSKAAEQRGLSQNAMVILALETYMQQMSGMDLLAQYLPLLPELQKQAQLEQEKSASEGRA